MVSTERTSEAIEKLFDSDERPGNRSQIKRREDGDDGNDTQKFCQRHRTLAVRVLPHNQFRWIIPKVRDRSFRV